MPEESTTPDLVELSRQAFDAANRHDLDAAMSVFGPDAVWKTAGLGSTYQGVAAIRGGYEAMIGAFDEFEVEAEEILNLGSGVTFAVIRLSGRPVGSSGHGGHVQMRYASVGVWVQARIVRQMSYLDIDEARAAAERLAEERGDG